MTAQQIRWAAQHDWYVGHSSEFIRVRHDLMADQTIDFFNYAELRAWAGY